MPASLLRGDARHLPLEAESVDLIVTSPPYFALRSYRDDGEHFDGQIGSENTPADFIAALMECASEWWRVLKPSGSVWVNLGDKMAGSGGGHQSGMLAHRKALAVVHDSKVNAFDGPRRYNQNADGVRPKSLMGLPWRFAIAMIDTGWILRAEVIWSKPNGLPESVTDRVRRSHEQWFHLVKEPRYYSAVDELREPHTGGSHVGRTDGQAPPNGRVSKMVETGERGGPIGGTNPDLFNPLGRLPGSVWTIPSEPLIVPPELGLPDHFAAFPQEWPRRLILGWSPPAICTVCDEGLRPQVASRAVKSPRHGDGSITGNRNGGPENRGWDGLPRFDKETSITGYSCACPEPGPTRPSVVLDPFGGTGTTAGVASMLGRHGISVDLSADYCRLARWRINESGHFGKTEQRTWRDRQQGFVL